MVKIESGVAAPAGRNRYPWKELKKGDSFAIPKGMTLSSFSGIVSNQGKRDGRTYRVGKDDKGKIRCWRIK